MSATERQAKFDLTGKKIWVAGHRGMVGSAIVRRLEQEACTIVVVDRKELDLTRQTDVEQWMAAQKLDAVFIAAARVGGILANDSFPAEFLYENLAIETNIIHSAWRTGVGKLLFLGASCLYPKLAPQPLVEDALLTGPLEPTNEWYAVAKIAGLKMCEAYRRQYGCDFIAAMPTNLLGPNDNYAPDSSHVVAALISRCHQAKMNDAEEVVVWGTGTPLREFLYVDDAADALVFLMRHYSGTQFVNVGGGEEVSIRAFADQVAKVVGYQGRFRLDGTKPDGSPRKALDSSRLRAMGWTPKTDLSEGLTQAYAWYLQHKAAQTE